jgi:hypothetical protein
VIVMQQARPTSAGIPAQSRSLLELIDQLREEFPELSAHTVVRCVSLVANHPSSTALPVEVLVRRTERIARARLTHLSEVPKPRPGQAPSVVTLPEPRVSQTSTPAQ